MARANGLVVLRQSGRTIGNEARVGQQYERLVPGPGTSIEARVQNPIQRRPVFASTQELRRGLSALDDPRLTLLRKVGMKSRGFFSPAFGQEVKPL